MLADGPAEIIHCGFPRDDSPGSLTLPMRLFKRHGTNAWFLAVYRLGAKPGPAELKVAPANAVKMTVTLRPGKEVLAHTTPRL